MRRISDHRLSRRGFVALTASVSVGALLAACGQQAPPAPAASPQSVEVTRVVTQVVQQQVPVTQVVQQTVVVTQPVPVTQVVTQVVQQQVVVTATPGPAKAKDRITVRITADETTVDKARTSHPWLAALQKYAQDHPEVDPIPQIRLAINSGGQDYWQIFATELAAGNPDDIEPVSLAGAASKFSSGIIPLLLDVGPYMTADDRADIGDVLIQGVQLQPGAKNFVMGWPTTVSLNPGFGANGNVLEAAGVDWLKYQTNGWTWDEFGQVLQKVSDPSKNRYAIGATRDSDWWSILIYLTENGGNPSASDVGIYAFGNVWNWTGPTLVKAAKLMQSWMQGSPKLTNPAFLGMSTLDETWNLVLSGQMVFTLFGGDYAIGYPKFYNDQVAAGKIAGKPIDTKIVVFPWPYDKAAGANPVSTIRGGVEMVFKQNPYKGDTHTDNAQKLAAWLQNTENQIAVAKWQEGTIPSRKSAQKEVPVTDPQLKNINAYDYAHLRWTHPYPHPVYSKSASTYLTPQTTLLLQGKVTPEQYDENIRKGADGLMAEWKKTAAKEAVAYWEAIPPQYPGPLYPNWKQRTQADVDAGR